MLFFVRESFPTFRADVDVLFGRELLRRGHQIDLVMQAGDERETLGARAWYGRTVWVGATDSGSGFLHRLHRHYLAVRHDFRSFRRARLQNYQAVQIRDKFLIAAFTALVARRRGLRFFYWLSFPEPESQLQRVRARTARYPLLSYIRGVLFGWLLYRWILPRCDHAFVQSEQMLRDVVARGIDPAKLTPVPMGIAAADVRTQPADAPTQCGTTADASGAMTLAYLGALDAQRRLEVLIEMLALLRQQGLKAQLLMIGGGGSDGVEDQARLERRAAELGILGHLEITGFLPRETALARLQRADICLSPFFPTAVLRSTSPTKLVEYLALGLPVVANDHPEQRRVLRESRAGVCVPWGARYFAKGVALLARLGPAVRCHMGERGRQWVLAHRTYGIIATGIEAKYLELLSVSKHAAR